MRRFTWLITTLGWALACGGRAQLTAGENDAAGGVFAGQGGSVPSSAGAAARAGMSGKLGAAHGGSGNVAGTGPVNAGGIGTIGGASAVAGATGTAGTLSAGGSCACDPIECAPGYVRVPNGYDCCDHCLSIACAQERAVYQAYRQPVFDEYATVGCKVDTDCGYYFDANRCGGRTCGIPLAQSVIGEVSAALAAYAEKSCDSGCPTEPEPSCDQPLNAVCVNGRCQ